MDEPNSTQLTKKRTKIYHEHFDGIRAYAKFLAHSNVSTIFNTKKRTRRRHYIPNYCRYNEIFTKNILTAYTHTLNFSPSRMSQQIFNTKQNVHDVDIIFLNLTVGLTSKLTNT